MHIFINVGCGLNFISRQSDVGLYSLAMTSNVGSREKSLPKDKTRALPATFASAIFGGGAVLTSSIDE